jgi:CBS domain-containing protein
MNAGELMTTDVVTIRPEESVGELIERFKANHITGVPVLDERGEVAGMISESDVLYADSDDMVGDYMSVPAISVDEGTPVEELAVIIKSKHINRLPVTREGRMVGIVTRDDLVSYLANILAWKRNL